MDLPGIRVKILLPQWWEGLISSNQVIEIIMLHHPELKKDSLTQYQPPRHLDNKSYVYYLTLDYEAQKYFAQREWRIHLLGITIRITDADTRKDRPCLQEDRNVTALSNIALSE
jgi:hypothetical protein